MEDLNTIMKIRTATLNDLDALTAVEAECFPAAEAAQPQKRTLKTAWLIMQTISG
jgi:hypothetical protein